ncbi:MAG: hypothetical protein ACOX9B_02970 [Candidatus Xenobium sp.]|jgi:hypothetical protein|nr:hypothetical protein [Burkholderiales bacterium]
MNCTRCGQNLDADSHFCEGCGMPVAASPSSPTLPAPPAAAPPPGRSRLLIPLVVAGCGFLLFLMLAGGLGLWWWLDRDGGVELPKLAGLPSPPPSTGIQVAVASISPDDSTPSEDPTYPAQEVASEPSPPPSPPTPPAQGTDQVEWGPKPEIPVILFVDQADVNGDGRIEQVQIISSAGNSDPTVSAPRRFRVVDEAGKTLFQTEEFTEPFLVDLDELADHPANRAGIHVVKGSGRWPDIRIVFASASGNFVVFRFDGSTYQLVETGG